MPWEKSFDENAALDKAMQIFWEKGYEPASISRLLEGTGLNKGSLYNAFGGKRQLFQRSLLKYDQDHRRAMLAELEAMDDPRAAIASFFDGLVAGTASDAQQKGCFIINTALELDSHDEQVQTIVTTGLREIEAFFRRSIEVAQARGDMPTELVPAATAKALLGLTVSIRVLGRGAFSEASLQDIATEAKRLVGITAQPDTPASE